MSIDEGT